MRTTALWAIFFLLWAGAGFYGPYKAYCEQRELKTEEPEKTDAVLVIDASGSMRITDPQRLRDEGAKLFAQSLKAGDRLAIVEFSDEAHTIRPLGDYHAEDSQSIAADIAKVGNSGEFTNLLAGIKQAKAILDADKREDASQVIVLLSDGKMDPKPESGTAATLIASMKNDYLPDFKLKGTKIHTLAFSDQADKELLTQISEGTDGSHWYTPTADKIHESFAELFLVVKKPQILPLTSKGFKIDEDIQEATFYINREQDAGDITVKTPDGRTLNAASTEPNLKWFHGQKFDVITVVKPVVGDWQVTGLTSNDGFATVLTNLKLVTDWPTSFAAAEEILLQARLYESDKPINLPEMTGSVNFAFQISPTDKIAEPIIRDFLVDDGTQGDKIAKDGIFSAKVTLEDPGDYKLRLVAKGPTFERNQQIPFRVKPRLIGLSVVSAEEILAVPDQPKHKKEGEGDEHEKEEKEDPHKPKEDEPPPAKSEDLFLVQLSAEVSKLKNLEVKLIGVDEDHKRFNLPLEKRAAPGEGFQYTVPARRLPHHGIYEMEASFAAIDAKKKKVKASSKILTYDKQPSEHEEHEEAVPVTEEVEHHEEPSALPYVLAVTLVNIVCGALSFVLVKKIKASGEIVVPQFFARPQLATALAGIQQKTQLADFDINDPLLLMKAEGGAEAPHAAPAGTSAPAEEEVAPAAEGEAAAPAGEGEAAAEAAPEATEEPPAE